MDYNLIKITDDTVLSGAGICYFDPIEETIKEIGDGYIMGTNPYTPVIHKLLFVATNNSIKYLKIKVNDKNKILDKYDIKIQPGAVTPGLESFNSVPSFNEFVVTESIQPYSFIPFYVYIKSNGASGGIVNVPLEITYDDSI